jgi:aspartate racemase
MKLLGARKCEKQMRLLGLIGGMSWESTLIYYRLLNESVRARLCALHSARLLLWSFDFAEIAKLPACNDWNGLTDLRQFDFSSY